MSVIYGYRLATQLEQAYFDDLKECREISVEEWNKTGMIGMLTYAVARLISSFL